MFTSFFLDIGKKIFKHMIWIREPLSFKELSQRFPRPLSWNKKASILYLVIVVKVFVGLCWLFKFIHSNGEYGHSRYCQLPGIIKALESPYILQETEDIYQNFIKLKTNIPSRTKSLKMVS